MTNLITDLREGADWLAEELPVEARIAEAPQFLEGDPTHDQLIAFAVEKMREAADKIDKDRDMDVSLMELLAKARAENEQLRLAIMGGEDAPRYAMSLPLADLLQTQKVNRDAYISSQDDLEREMLLAFEAGCKAIISWAHLGIPTDDVCEGAYDYQTTRRAERQRELEAPCADCGGTGITYQTERRCACTLTEEEARAWQETREGMNRL